MKERSETAVETEKQADRAGVDENRIFTIPNLMSLFRLLLIPVIVWLYVKEKKYLVVAGLLVLSGLTDVTDGFIARHFNQISNLGKILDPVADKFTEGIMMILLAFRYPAMWFAIGAFALGALLMPLWGLKAMWADKGVNSARWHGKATTVVLYIIIAVLLVSTSISEKTANILILTATAVALANMTAYGLFYRKLLKNTAVQEEKQAD